MHGIRSLTDKTAIGLSLACAIHCLAFPLMIVMLPSLTAISLDGEAFHLWMVCAVIPTSLFALTLGCKRHKRYIIGGSGAVGMLLMAIAVIAGAGTLGEIGEKALTVFGALMIAVGHYWNFQLCRKQDRCECPEDAEKAS